MQTNLIGRRARIYEGEGEIVVAHIVNQPQDTELGFKSRLYSPKLVVGVLISGKVYMEDKFLVLE